jgi:hypothetical protein
VWRLRRFVQRGGHRKRERWPSRLVATAAADCLSQLTTARHATGALPEPPMKWDGYPNLRKRPPTPAKARGSIQRAIRRAFAATSASALTSTQIYDWAHGRRRLGRRKSMPFGVYSRTLRTLKVMCYRVGRGTSIGRPWLWRLRNTADD